jgi:antitoxin ParD1/3/4
MQVALKPELQQFVEDQVRAGRFATIQEALEAAVARLMLDSDGADLDEATMDAIERAEAQFERGEGIPLDDAFVRLRQKYQQRR